MKDDILCWWSGGTASAVACKLSIDLYGIDNCKLLFIDTHNESPDTYRFKKDCEKWYGAEIKTLSAIGYNKKYSCIEDVWFDFLSLNVANGAICSSELKRQIRLDYQKRNDFKHQVFGYDVEEVDRAIGMLENYPASKPIFPLLFRAYDKKLCIRIVEEADINVPIKYHEGFLNNNCWETGCVKGGIGYWQKIDREEVKNSKGELLIDKMAKVEHDLTDLKGKPVTCLRDQSNFAKKSGIFNVFLKPHPKYPENKSLKDMTGREPESLIDCNGFCGTQVEIFN